jgi:hypothetical protein
MLASLEFNIFIKQQTITLLRCSKGLLAKVSFPYGRRFCPDLWQAPQLSINCHRFLPESVSQTTPATLDLP